MTLLLLSLACTSDTSKDDTAGTTGTDDSGTDTETTDTYATDPTEGPRTDPDFDAEHVLITSSMNQVDAYDNTGATVASWVVNDFVTDSACDGGQCRAEGVTADGDGLVINWALQDREMAGGLLRLDPGGSDLDVTWFSDGWSYPHEVRRHPGTSMFIVADATGNGIFWVSDDASGDPGAAAHEIGESMSSAIDAYIPNGMDLIQDGGNTWLLVSYRGNDPRNPGNEDGKLAMYDISDLDDISMVWSYPPSGTLSAPHDPSIHWRDGRWLVLYAQSHGLEGEAGTIGIAETSDLSVAPTYIYDLVPSTDEWGYPRGAALAGDGELLVTDTPGLGGGGGGGSGDGGVYRTRLPTDLTPSGKSGSYSEGEQELVEVDHEVFVTGLDQAYRSFLWVPTW